MHHSQPTRTITRPLVNHPQLEIISTPVTIGLVDNETNSSDTLLQVEYRVYNYKQLDGGRIIRGDGWNLLTILVFIGLTWTAWSRAQWNGALAWQWSEQTVTAFLWIISPVIFLKHKCNAVLYETVIPLPSLGIQLSVTKGVSIPSLLCPFTSSRRCLIPLSTSYTFIPLSDISTVILNQALTRFTVRYYLGIVKKRGEGIVLAFHATRPGFQVLKEIYHGVRELMFGEFDDISNAVLDTPGKQR
ncbi:uncharacterized protein IL334_006276 [Kwoniella shivajii]|uniref:Phosphatidylinositol N-acetylglucosaminyltransferase subunit H conserved domain-containing protein n=1 Tax=Kwoniella shivajii TaxID=564305 RepID=A0ABZ1D5I3_9TREE|nr:hypothetical protein IL334_006276 [Kwoniella shivajii]